MKGRRLKIYLGDEVEAFINDLGWVKGKLSKLDRGYYSIGPVQVHKSLIKLLYNVK